jgi:NADPH:quinone reductase-like Zn-dependent oxidoreductase
MQACSFDRYGGPDVLRVGEHPQPVPRADQVLVRVRAAGLNPVDFKTREGKVRVLLPYRLPLVPGNELCGDVVACGRDVGGFAPGQRVAARVAKLDAGAFAEFAAVDAELLAPVPDGVPDEVAAGLPLAGLTAWQCLTEVLRVQPGQRVLIHAGSGGVGHLAIQLAKALGAVVATTGSAARFSLLRELGADECVDWRSERFEDRIAPVDAVLDTQGGEILRRSIAHTKRGGAVVSIGGIPTPEIADEFGRPAWLRWLFAFLTRRERALARAGGVRYRYWFMHPDGAQLRELLARVADRRLRVIVEVSEGITSFPDAFAALEAGRTVGKRVVRIARG